MFEILTWFLMLLPFALWGTAMAAMAPLVQSGGPEFVASLRLLPAGILVLLVTFFFKRNWQIAKSDLVWFVVFTVIDGTIFQYFLAKGLIETGAGLGSVFIDSQPLIVALLSRALFSDAINPIGWVGLMLGLGGIICLGVAPSTLNNWFLLGGDFGGTSLLSNGEVWMLGAAIAMALGTVLIRFACRQSDPVAVTGWHMVFGSIPLVLWHCFNRNWPLLPDWSTFDWTLMAYSSVFGSAIAYGLFFWFANQKELTTFSSLAFLTPVFALVTGGIWLDERLSFLQWVGVSLVLASVVLVSQRKRLWEKTNSFEENIQ